mmetsp:Transcript_18267/g.52084  ORF Transcript_18267/g.52084 Transcript_18267/m.52084 type:complete len:270 (+) Transcript_18267:540-1349(+)
MVPRTYSMVSMTWWMNSSLKLKCSCSSSSSSSWCSPSPRSSSSPSSWCTVRGGCILCQISSPIGLGNSITGMEMAQRMRRMFWMVSWPPKSCSLGSMAEPFMGARHMLIMVLMRPGLLTALTEGSRSAWRGPGVIHLNTIMKSMYPNNATRKMICGTNSKKKSSGLAKCMVLNALRTTPRPICATPTSTANFILYELRNSNSFCAPFHAQSRPNGVGLLLGSICHSTNCVWDAPPPSSPPPCSPPPWCTPGGSLKWLGARTKPMLKKSL